MHVDSSQTQKGQETQVAEDYPKKSMNNVTASEGPNCLTQSVLSFSGVSRARELQDLQDYESVCYHTELPGHSNCVV